MLKIKCKTLAAVLLLCVLFACQGDIKHEDTEGLLKYIAKEHNGLHLVKEVNGIQFKADYLPLSVQALREFNRSVVDSLAFYMALQEYIGHHYLQFSIQPDGSQFNSLKKVAVDQQADWETVKSQLDFSVQKQFLLTTGSGDKPCVLYHPFAGINPSQGYSFLVLFKDENAQYPSQFDADLQFTYEDRQFTQQSIDFTFKQQDLNKIPLLKF